MPLASREIRARLRKAVAWLTDPNDLRAFVFKNRGALLALPAVALALGGKPSKASARARNSDCDRRRVAALLGGRLFGRNHARRHGRSAGAGHRRPVRVRSQSAVRRQFSDGLGICDRLYRATFAGGAYGRDSADRSASWRPCTRRSFRTKKSFCASSSATNSANTCATFRRSFRERRAWSEGRGTWRPEVIREAESRTFLTFGAMLAALLFKLRS